MKFLSFFGCRDFLRSDRDAEDVEQDGMHHRRHRRHQDRQDGVDPASHQRQVSRGRRSNLISPLNNNEAFVISFS